LSEEERQEMLLHPSNGAEMVRDIPYLQVAIPVIRYHHERWDGSGYPEGLVGEQIPVEARLIAVADVFDAMTTDRPYHKAETLDNAYQYILSKSGILFDPMVVHAFQRVWEAGKIHQIAEKYHSG
jgi:putative two-component system response regulator